jgi:diguanylate cyclase (GGDEF)-like protein/PAS domain S-box-containing protein
VVTVSTHALRQTRVAFDDPLPSKRSTTRYRTWALWALVVAALCFAQVIHPDGFVGYGTYLLATVGAAVAATLGAVRHESPARFAWRFVALGLACSAVGDVIYSLLVLVNGEQPEFSVADAFWLASYIALAIGLSTLIVGSRGWRRVDMDGLIDMGSFVVLAVIVVVQFAFVRDVVDDQSVSTLTRTVWALYPVFDVALFAIVAQAIISRRMRGVAGVFVSCGVALWMVSDLGQLIGDVQVITMWLDVGWMLGAVALAASTWPQRATDVNERPKVTAVGVTNGRIAITLTPLLVPGAIEMWAFSEGRDANPLPLLAASVALVSLAFARSSRLVRAQRRQAAALARSAEYYGALAENSSDAVIVVDVNRRILNEAPNLTAMLGRTGATTTGMDAVELLDPVNPEPMRAAFDRWWLTNSVVSEGELHATQVDGSDRWFDVRAVNLSNVASVGGMVVNLRDITDLKRVEDSLNHSSFHDSLTGLANRALFHDRLERALVRSTPGVAVVYLDLDGFKVVNDSRGHEAGDQVLRDVATRLTKTVRSVDTVSRLGGDEFAILIEDSPRALDEAETVAQRVLQALTEPFIFDTQRIVLSASIGITVGDISCTASSMLRDADVAMYRAKTTGKAKWALYEPEMRAANLERLELDSDLRQALEKQQLRLVYMPIVELQSNRIAGFEALLRWDHPTRGVVQPGSFIPLAEANGTIVEIGHWVLDEACRTAALWHDAYPALALSMSVNLSARQIATAGIVEQVAHALEQSGCAPTSLILEITESTLVQDAETASRRLQALRSLDVRLSIDDFGTGYSSLSYLRQFPIDILKIDKSFTDTITDRSQIPAIVRGLLDLAKTLRMKTVAEGIELDVQRDSLRDHHCDYGQGYLFARPLTFDEATVLLTDLQATARRSV